MPIKRAKSKRNSVSNIWGDLLLEFSLKKLRKKDLIRKARNQIENDVQTAVRAIPRKKIMNDSSHPMFWGIAIEYFSKDLISRVINHRGTRWDRDFFKECLRKHQDNNYIKKS